jgi:hypothetical protein
MSICLLLGATQLPWSGQVTCQWPTGTWVEVADEAQRPAGGPGPLPRPGPSRHPLRAHWATASAALAAAAVKSRTNTVTIEEASWEPGFPA